MELQRKSFETEVGGKILKLEVSKIAEQAASAVIGKYGDTTVLATVVVGGEDRDIDYMPLSVNYEERFYAVGKILGSRFLRREGKPSDEAILSGRLVDRAIRPLFDNRTRRDIQVIVTILSFDEEHDPDLLALNAASAAIFSSNIPWKGPVGGVKVAKIDGQLVINPKLSELAKGKVEFETFVAGSRGKINMIELSGDDAKESEIMEAFKLASKEIDKILDFQEKLQKEVGSKKIDINLKEPPADLKKAVGDFLSGKLEKAIYVKGKTEREANLTEVKEALKTYLKESGVIEADQATVNYLFEGAVDIMVHEKILKEDLRPDSRKLDEVRELYGETNLLPRTHGSALFVRGNTQALGVVTLAAPGSEQLIETMEQSGNKRFMLHYNFPPYSVGETGRVGTPDRREIGHGALAEKAVSPLIPNKENFPYTIRVVSEVLSSNGSSSMATVCASVMALMDAGVPIKKPAAGIAMGLMIGEEGYKVLTDIQGPEDHYGDMDLKIAGTREGVNAIQMDVKIDGVSFEILEKSFEQARQARLHILDFIDSVIKSPKAELSEYAPRVLTLNIDPEKIGEVIGPGGKIINNIVARTGAISINIEQTGLVYIAGSKESAAAALAEVKNIVKKFEIGEIIEGPIIKILDFGAIVDLGGGRDGMIHVSELRNGFVEKVTDIVKLGEVVKAKVIKTDNGKIGLSIKQL
ncbi:MAG TPA: polyribonucleotide nucleotidyltransferase [Candidatus Paceibacterota bacterium]|nr:polyribonucleotide nucleotidyltransferase [Candidatus Paceibacterota bacterium]